MKSTKHKKLNLSWKEFIFSFIILSFFGALPGIMYGGDIFKYFFPFGFWYFIYWGLISVLFILVTSSQRKKAFEEPMIILSDATQKVASGDFSVYIKPIITLDQSNYINQMFMDFNKMVEELGSIETMKTDFIANVSHEIKTPLANIQGYVSMLQSENLSKSDRDLYKNSLIKASKRLSILVTNILQLSKLENQGIVSTKQSYNVCEQLRDEVSSFIELWDEKEIQYHIEIEDYATLFADPAIVSIIWRNLLSNATKFSQQKGRIEVKQFSNEDSITVLISDDGIGMNETTIKHMYEKFYQGDTSHSIEGNGLGMALIARSIELLDGTISVQSKLGHGTTFQVKLFTQE